jgi:hypothetical protein
MPILIAFLLLVVDFGVLGYMYVSITNGVREGARYTATKCAGVPVCLQSDVRDRVVTGSTVLDPAQAASEVFVWYCPRSPNPSSAALPHVGDSIRVMVYHPQPLLMIDSITVPMAVAIDMVLEKTETNVASDLPKGPLGAPVAGAPARGC